MQQPKALNINAKADRLKAGGFNLFVENKLSGQAVADIVKAYALKAGFSPMAFAGHSLRSSFVTSAAENGANLFKIYGCIPT